MWEWSAMWLYESLWAKDVSEWEKAKGGLLVRLSAQTCKNMEALVRAIVILAQAYKGSLVSMQRDWLVGPLMFWVQGRVQKSNADLSALLRLLPRVFPRAFPCSYVVARCRRTCFCAPSLAAILGVPDCNFATKYDTNSRLFVGP